MEFVPDVDTPTGLLNLRYRIYEKSSLVGVLVDRPEFDFMQLTQISHSCDSYTCRFLSLLDEQLSWNSENTMDFGTCLMTSENSVLNR